MSIKSFLISCFFFGAAINNIIQAQDLKLVLPIGHTDKIYEAHFSPDGRKIVTASKDKTAKIWDVSNGNLVADLKGHSSPVVEARFSPDGQKVFTHEYNFNGQEDIFHQVKIWDAITGALITSVQEKFVYISSPSFSPDSKKILTVADTLKIWNSVSGKLMVRLAGNYQGNNLAQFSPDGKWIVLAAEDNSIYIFDASSGRLVRNLKGHTANARIMVFSANLQTLTTITSNETIQWNAASWAIIKKIPGQFDGELFSLTTDGKKIVTADYAPEKKSVTVWDAATRKKIRTEKGISSSAPLDFNSRQDNGLSGNVVSASNDHLAAVLNTAYHNKPQIFLDNDKTAMIWQLDNRSKPDSLKGHTDAINFLQFSFDGTKLVTASDDGTAKVWDASNGNLLADLKSHTYNSRAGIFIHDQTPHDSTGNKLVTVTDNGTATIWDLNAASLEKVYPGESKNLFSVQFSSGPKKIISGSQDGSILIWDLDSGKHVYFRETSSVGIDPTSEADMEVVTRLVPPVLSPDGKKILAAIQTNKAQVLDAESGKELFQFKNSHYPKIAYGNFSPDGSKYIFGYRYYDHEPDKVDTNSVVFDVHSGNPLYKIEATHAEFSPDNDKLIAVSNKGLHIYDAENGHLKYTLANKFEETYFTISPDGKKLFTSNWLEQTGRFWNVENGKRMLPLQSARAFISAKYSGDGKKLITLAENRVIDTWDTENGILLYSLSGHTDDINYYAFSPDSKYIVTASRDNTLKTWDASNGKCIYTFFAVDSADYFVQLPNGYYKGTPNASKRLHYLTRDLRSISFEQLDVKYNRPDLVLEAIGNKDTAMINTYRNAYYKRIKKLGIDTTSFTDGYSVPEADFVNRKDIALEQKNEMLDLMIKGIDSSYQLDRFNLWVNEVPVFGQRGSSIRNTHANSFEETVSVKLSQGINRIETSVTNVNGTESYRIPLTIYYTPASAQKEKTYFIGIGIDQFKDTSFNLNYSVKDIRDLSAKLKQQFGNDIIIDTLFNENVTVSNVKALKQKLQQTSVNDKVIISYSGHGLLSKEFDYFLSTYAVNFKNPAENGLPYDALERLLDSIPARKKLMLIDACHSGEVDKEEFQQVRINQSTLAANHVVSRGGEISESGEDSQKLGLKNSFELMRNLFVNVGKSTGATIISAAAGTEFALENGNLKNGVFTYCIMEAMDKYPTMKVSELKKIVGARVHELTNGMQKPTSRNEAIAVDWNVW